MIKVKNPRDSLIRLITFLGGIYFVLEFLLPESVLKSSGIADHHESITNGFLAAVYVSIGLGIINLCLVHGSKIVFRRKGALYSGILLTGLFTMIAVAAIDWVNSVKDAAEVRRVEVLSLYAKAIPTDATSQRADVLPVEARIRAFIPELEALAHRLSTISPQSESLPIADQPSVQLHNAIDHLKQNPSSLEALTPVSPLLEVARGKISAYLTESRNQRLSRRLFSLLFDGVFTSLGSSMFALLAFYIAAAAYRAFRIQSIEAFLMMTAALLVILGQTSFGLMVSESFASIRLWLLEVPSAGVFRAIKLGAGIAALVLCIRMWFSVEAKQFSGGSSGG